MADWTQNVTNSVNCFGPAPSTKWGAGTPYTSTWSVAKWGEGTADLQSDFTKLIDNSEAMTSAIAAISFVKIIENSQASTFELSSETLQDSAGYYYVFPYPVTNADSRSTVTFTAADAASTTWTSATTGSVTWS